MPPEQQAIESARMVRDGLTESLTAEGITDPQQQERVILENIRKAQADGWDVGDLQKMAQNKALDMAGGNPEALQDPNFMQAATNQFTQWFSDPQTSGWEKMALLMGIPMALFGLFNAFTGGGGLGNIIGLLGLGGAGYGIYNMLNHEGGDAAGVGQAQPAAGGGQPAAQGQNVPWYGKMLQKLSPVIPDGLEDRFAQSMSPEYAMLQEVLALPEGGQLRSKAIQEAYKHLQASPASHLMQSPDTLAGQIATQYQAL